MTSTLAYTDGSVTVTRARVTVPAWGRWWADVDCSEESGLDAGDDVTLTLGGVGMVGAVVHGGDAYGRSAYRIVGGPGWSDAVSEEGYQDDAGVQYSTVIQDVATAVGETVSSLPSTRGGQHFVRRAGAAVNVLQSLVPRDWYVGLDGTTVIGLRADSTYTGTDTRTMRKVSDRIIEVETSDLTPFVPGVDVDSIGPAVDVEYCLDGKRLTATLVAGEESRGLDAFRRAVESCDPCRTYRGAYEYRVVSQNGDTLDLQPVRVSTGLSDLSRVPVRFGSGQSMSHALGSLVVVMFLDADPTRPFVAAGAAAGEPGWTPTVHTVDGDAIKLGDSALLGVARLGDTVGPYVITSASSKVKAE